MKQPRNWWRDFLRQWRALGMEHVKRACFAELQRDMRGRHPRDARALLGIMAATMVGGGR